MNNINLGYACINMELSNAPKTSRVTTNRSMIKRTFKEKGLDYASELALANCKDLIKILQWNEARGIKFFRLSARKSFIGNVFSFANSLSSSFFNYLHKNYRLWL